MSHLVVPHAQSLCFAVHFRHDQFSHQIHLRWFTSSTKRATIQRRISVRDTPSTYRYRGEHGMGRAAQKGPPGVLWGFAARGGAPVGPECVGGR